MDFCSFWSQRCVEVSKTCGRSFITLQRNFVQLTLSTLSNQLLVAQVFLNLTNRWRSLTPDNAGICWIHLEQRCLKFVYVKYIFQNNIGTYETHEIPWYTFFKGKYHRRNCVFQFYDNFCDYVVAKLAQGKEILKLQNSAEKLYLCLSLFVPSRIGDADAADALMLLMRCCYWCADALMLMLLVMMMR